MRGRENARGEGLKKEKRDREGKRRGGKSGRVSVRTLCQSMA